MTYYIEVITNGFPYELSGVTTTIWTEKLLKVDNIAKDLDIERKSIILTFAIKDFFYV